MTAELLVPAVADPGGAPPARPPYGSRFFRFDIQIFRNVAASGVGASPYVVGAPPTGNPGSATESWLTVTHGLRAPCQNGICFFVYTAVFSLLELVLLALCVR